MGAAGFPTPFTVQHARFTDVDMVDIGKTSVLREEKIRSQLNRVDVQELLRDVNIFELKGKKLIEGVDAKDIEAYMQFQFGRLREQILQDAEVKAVGASYPSPEGCLQRFPIHGDDAAITSDESKALQQGMAQSVENGRFEKLLNFKATETTKKKTSDKQPLTLEELNELASGTLDEYDQFMEDTWGMIIDAQMMRDMTAKTNELKAEVERIVALVKQGAMPPEFALLAMMKVKETQNGCLMVGLGKKASHINESLNNIANELKGAAASDPAQLQVAQAKTRDGAFQLNLLVTDMQKVTQDSASRFDQIKGVIDMLNSTRRQIVQNMRGT